LTDGVAGENVRLGPNSAVVGSRFRPPLHGMETDQPTRKSFGMIEPGRPRRQLNMASDMLGCQLARGLAVATSAPFARLDSPEGTEQLGERLLHLIGCHRKPAFSSTSGVCVDGAYQRCWSFSITVCCMATTSGRPKKRRASSGVQSTSMVTFMMRFLFMARPAIGAKAAKWKVAPQAKHFRVR